MEAAGQEVEVMVTQRRRNLRSLAFGLGIFLVVASLVDFWLLEQAKSTFVFLKLGLAGCAFVVSVALKQLNTIKDWHYGLTFLVPGALLVAALAYTPAQQQFFVLVTLTLYVYAVYATAIWKPISGMVFYLLFMALVAVSVSLAPQKARMVFADSNGWILLGTLVAPLLLAGKGWRSFEEEEHLATTLLKREASLAQMTKSNTSEGIAETSSHEQKLRRVALHDINNRIASLHNLHKLFAIKFEKMQDENLQKYNEKLEEIATELKVFADNMMTPAPNKHYPEIRIQKEEVEIKPFLERTVEDARPKAHPKNVRLNLIQTNKEVYVSVDATYLKVILRNLLNYAIKFSQTNNEVIISTSLRNALVYVEIMDKSRGVEKEMLDRMFNFLPDDIEASMEESTQGIGLSVAKYLAEAMGGVVEYESSVELGLHFSLIFDIAGTPDRTDNESQPLFATTNPENLA